MASSRGVEHALNCAGEPALDGAVLNFIFNGVTTLPVAERLHARGIPMVFYTAFEAAFVARATAHMKRAIVTNPGSAEAVASALTALIGNNGS